MTVSVHAEVRLHGRPVGTLSYDRGGSAFRYHDDLDAPDHQVLGQIFEDDPGKVRAVRVGLPPWFANLLPEGELRRQVVREMGGGRVGDFRLLLRLGADLPGAVTVRAEAEPDDADDPTAATGMAASPADHPLRYSLAGVQLKYSIHGSRLTIPVSGDGGYWIVKLPDRALTSLAENEYLTMRWLAAAGIDVPPVAIVPAEAVKDLPDGLVSPHESVYVIRRFDRPPEGRIHVEDFAQIADVDPRFKYGEFGATYDSVGRVLRHLTGAAGFAAYLARLTAMIIVGNTDAHLKNWALWYPDGWTPALSPVYDFHSLTVYDRFRYAPLAMSLGGEQMANLISLDHFRRLAEVCGDDPDQAAGHVAAAVDRLRTAWTGGVDDDARVRFPALADHYRRRLAELAICRGL